MSDRLSQLHRQRALLQEHLAWLDREIAAASEKPAATAPAPELKTGRPLSAVQPPPASAIPAATALPATTPVAATTITEAPPSPVEAAASDAILEKYRVPTGNLQQDVRKGCFLYFAASFVLLGALVAILYYMVSSR